MDRALAVRSFYLEEETQTHPNAMLLRRRECTQTHPHQAECLVVTQYWRDSVEINFSISQYAKMICQLVNLQINVSTYIKQMCELCEFIIQTCITSYKTNMSKKQNKHVICKTNISTCTNIMSTCKTNMSTCKTNMSTCKINMSTCKTNMSTCKTNLSTYKTNAIIQN